MLVIVDPSAKVFVPGQKKGTIEGFVLQAVVRDVTPSRTWAYSWRRRQGGDERSLRQRQRHGAGGEAEETLSGIV